eukprot:657418-Pelagomonas_calceolata.AAC.1
MLLPASGRHMMTNPHSELLNAYPHLCYKLEPFQEADLSMTNPNPGPARKLSSLSIPGIYKLLQSAIQLQEFTLVIRTIPGFRI